MGWAPAVEREFCNTQTNGKKALDASPTSVMAKRKTSNIANAIGMLNMYAQNIVLGVTTLAFLTSSAGSFSRELWLLDG